MPNKKDIITYLLFVLAAFGSYKALQWFVANILDGLGIFGFLLHIPITIFVACAVGLGVASLVLLIWQKITKK
jgi:hypothetical protein